ncbi:hypothetical protein [Silvibacterium acidisoli]|uniref:hypothetical protein n=1 Tax=Acidobacteriaceae bacterium ZG23-2 TaxID=2883246 RepID=UPI00406BF402
MAKGPKAEEALRNYFVGAGFFVVRGCKFRFNQFDVTDIDIWLYSKTSPLGRQRLNVDIKNKKTPQALERIFWAKGLQSVLELDGCIVATTDTRPDVREFGLQHEVTVLDGKFLARLTKNGRTPSQRISEEELLVELEQGSMGKLGGDWRGRYELSKSRLLTSLTFDGSNAWLQDVAYFLEAFATAHAPQPTLLRMVYICSAYFLVSVDFILREHVVAEHEQRRELLDSGFRYGSAGRAFTEKVGRMAASLVEGVSNQVGIGETIVQELGEQVKVIRADLLADFFSRTSTHSYLFEMAKDFESAAFAVSVPTPSQLPSQTQSVLGVFADFCSLDRKRILV